MQVRVLPVQLPSDVVVRGIVWHPTYIAWIEGLRTHDQKRVEEADDNGDGEVEPKGIVPARTGMIAGRQFGTHFNKAAGSGGCGRLHVH